jgi:CBS domain-containing protein
VYDAVARLKEHQIGALFVVAGSDLVGVISERDYARKIILDGRSSKGTRVDQIMSSPVVCVGQSTPLAECMHLISERRIRHLAVVEGGRLVGVVSIGDLMQAIILQQQQTIEQLNTLISDPYPA